jgi:Domain of unknown function (DUF4124)
MSCRKPMMNRWSLVVMTFAACTARADIYKFVDDQGVTTYTNVPSRLPASGASKVAVDPPPPPVPAGAPSNPQARAKPSSPANFPRVDSETQKQRDSTRRQILEDELKSEEKLLDEARLAAAEGEATRQGDERNYQKYLDRVQKLKDEVEQHEKNVAALRRELANLR